MAKTVSKCPAEITKIWTLRFGKPDAPVLLERFDQPTGTKYSQQSYEGNGRRMRSIRLTGEKLRSK
jgi:hypothetical protein